MSECPVGQPVDEAVRPSRPAGGALYVVPERPPAMSPEESKANLRRLRDRVRRDAALARQHGLLGRYGEPDDPDHGAGLYEALVFQDTSGLSDAGWLDRLEAIVQLEARLAAFKAEAIAGHDAALQGVSAELGHRYPEPGDRAAASGERRWVAGDLRSVADEIALVLQMHKGPATARIHTSCELVHNFPSTLRALREGELTERAAFTIVRELSVLDDLEALRAAEAAVLDWASKHPLAGIKQVAQQEAAQRDPAARSKAHARAMDERSVRMFPTSDGTADLVHTQDAIDAAAVMNSLSRAAAYRRRQGDTRTLDQLRADIALARLLPRTKNTRGATDAADSTPDNTTTGAGASAGTPDRPRDDDPVDDHTVADGPGDRDHARFRGFPGSAADAADETTIGADTTVVIHATGAELRALIDSETGTGGEAEHHGPIPQSSLRKHLIRALARALLPDRPNGSRGPNRGNDPGPGTSSPPGGTGPRPSGGTGPRPGDDMGERWRGGSGPNEGHAALPPTTPSTAERAVAALGDARARIDIRVTDEPPIGDPDRYTPTAAADRYVRLRDRTCQFPGCNRPAEFTDLDHRVAFAEGGRTTTQNLHCLCRHHHRLKHQGGWTITPNPDGTTTWTSPTGRHYRTPAPEA